jgi:hypothetical protein
MPRYFFNVRIGSGVVEDVVGLEITDPGLALPACRRAISEAVEEEEEDDWTEHPPGVIDVEVVDEIGRTILVVPFRR